MLETTPKDIESLQSILGKGFVTPNIKISVYKNRRGRYKSVFLWCKANRSTCRIEPMFITNLSYELQSIDDLKITVQEEEESAF